MINLRQLGAAVAAMALCPASAMAADTSTICTTLSDGRVVVDKEVLATRLLQKFSISLTALNPAAFSSIDPKRPSASILAHADQLCHGAAKCSKADTAAIGQIEGWMDGLFVQGAVKGFTAPSPPVPANVFFATDNATDAAQCKQQMASQDHVVGDAVDKTSGPSPFIKFQVRATPDQLGVQDGTGSQFAGANPASINVVRDGVAKTWTYKVSGVLGYAFVNTDPTSQVLGTKVIGYVSGNYSAVRAFSGPSKVPSSDSVDVGIAFSTTLMGASSALVLQVRPDFLRDYTDGSELFTTNFRAIPYVRSNGLRVLNDYADLGLVWIEPTLDFRLDAGRFVQDGANKIAAASPELVRLGSQVGFNVVANDEPLTFNTSYTYLDALAGKINIGYFSNTLTYTFGAQKNFGISLIYNNGVLESTAKRQEQSSLSVTLKY